MNVAVDGQLCGSSEDSVHAKMVVTITTTTPAALNYQFCTSPSDSDTSRLLLHKLRYGRSDTVTHQLRARASSWLIQRTLLAVGRTVSPPRPHL